MHKHIIALVLTGLASPAVTAASDGENQANSFEKHYASICLKHLNNLDALRENLKSLPKLPPEKASHFLAGNAGDAWPVPDQYGAFVLALPAGKNMCTLHLRRADTEVAKKQFIALVGKAPSPLVAKQVRNEKNQTAANGPTQTVAYEWSVPNAPRKMLFTLTIAPSETARLQVLGSAAIVSQ